MKRWRLRAEAETELRDAARWLEAQQEGLGLALLENFDERIGAALAVPGAGTLEGTTADGVEVRSHRLERFTKYFILAAEIDDVLIVVAFKHGSRHPNYWRMRTAK